MIRVVFFLIIVGALAVGVAWLADRPGEVVVTWQGWRIETSVMVLAAAVLAAMAVLALLWSIISAVLRSPSILLGVLHDRRGARAYQAISRGLIAVGAGDTAAARKFTAEVNRIAPAEPLALLLSAQAAQLAGDREAADRTFRTMAARSDTKSIGLHGLFVEAQRRDDFAGARAYAEEAARTNPALGWAGKAVLELRCATGDWAGALALLDGNKRALDKAVYRRQRAVMLTARAIADEETDRDNAKAFALEAVKLAPTLVPAAALAARRLAEAGDVRKAARIVDKAWRVNPHPELAQVLSELRFGDAGRDRLKRIEGLVRKSPGGVEGAVALARAALDAQEFAKARNALAPYLAAPTRRIALLMADIERAEHNDEGRAREWIARAVTAAPDPVWTADGYVSDRWLAVSPVSGRLDAFVWRVPLTAIGAPSPMAEPETSITVAPQGESLRALPAKEEVSAESVAGGATPLRSRIGPPQSRADAVIPLVHAPDDPGPDEMNEGAVRPVEPQTGGWRKIFE